MVCHLDIEDRSSVDQGRTFNSLAGHHGAVAQLQGCGDIIICVITCHMITGCNMVLRPSIIILIVPLIELLTNIHSKIQN